MSNLRFSIITPTYNEEKDIRNTLEAFTSLSYQNKEIIVVDDSNDRTPEIVKEFESRGVRLVRGTKQGCCEAVNLGIEQATGDVVINADADVLLPKDFLERLAAHYDTGADWVLVESRMPESSSLFVRFVSAQHLEVHDGRGEKNKNVYYTEAFSCRRELALKHGMFGPAQPARFCRDWVLGKKLTEAGYKKVFDASIIVMHPQPDNFDEFWYVRKARGRFGPLQHYFMSKRSLSLMLAKCLVKDALFALRFLLIVPAVVKVSKLIRYSERKWKDFFPFIYAYFIQELARCVGEWEGYKINLKHALRKQEKQ